MNSVLTAQPVSRTSFIRTREAEAEIIIPPPGDFETFYLFAMHKSGSSLLNIMMAAALDRAGMPHISIGDTAFEAGLDGNSVINPEDLIFERGYCYRGYRRFPPYLRKYDISKKKKILLVRDPRDMLVSFYFSTARSHVLPEKGPERERFLARRESLKSVSIQEYCIQKIPYFKKEFDSYRHLMNTDIRIFRYEDVIFSKREWLCDMLHYLEIRLPGTDIDQIVRENDVRPAEERPDKHIRQVAPGNYRKHLTESTIETINAAFAEEFRRFDYKP